jgi:pyruvate,water dikinase
MKVILTGTPASLGEATGTPKIVINDDINDIVDGDVLVAEMTKPDYVPAMKRAVAIVTERGGRTCHAAIVARELGIPCITGAVDAINILGVHSLVTVHVTAIKGEVLV